MDPITHAVLGASCAQAILYRKDKKNAWLIGGLAAMAPDLDVFIRSSHNPMLFFLYHRYFTHSLIFIPIGALCVTLILLLFKKFRLHAYWTFLAAFIGYATHGVLDACTNYGTVLFWPFSNIRIHWNIVSIVDLYVTLPLFLGLVWTRIMDDRKGVIFGLLFILFFLTVNTLQHHRTESIINDQSQILSTYSEIQVFPQLMSSTSWRGVVKQAHQFFVFDIAVPFLRRANIQSRKIFPLFLPQNLPDYIKNKPTLYRDFRIFNWFTDGNLILLHQNPLVIADGRFLGEPNPSVALWSIQFLPNYIHAKELRFLKLE